MPGTFLANSAYWQSECKAVPANATYIKMIMGSAIDYFKPKPTKSMCDMLASPDQHQWSGDSKAWVTPLAATVGLGGSVDRWLANQSSATDKRDTPNFWGINAAGTQTGGCCYSDFTDAGKAWAKPFKMEYCGVPKVLAPICTPLITVAGSFSADKDFWTQTCKNIPMTASFVKVAMGSSTDFFRPPTGQSFCEMLTSNADHKWSSNGYDWVTPTYDTNVTTTIGGFGGSALKGVNGSALADGRTKASFWGSDTKTNTGGCCYDSPLDAAQGFGKGFTMSYCEIASAPPIAQLVELLHSNEAGVQALEKEISTVHTRLFAAENLNIDAAGNVSLASSGMYKLAAKAKDEADQLQALQLRSSMSGSSLDLMQNQLTGSEKQVRAAAKSAKATAAIAKQTASTKALESQDALNDKIWKLMDPTNEDNLDATEKRVRAMEQETDKFRGVLAGEVKTVMVTKLRRTVHRLRKAVHQLGTAGNKVSDGALGETESDAPLGADLGLDDA